MHFYCVIGKVRASLSANTITILNDWCISELMTVLLESILVMKIQWNLFIMIRAWSSYNDVNFKRPVDW